MVVPKVLFNYDTESWQSGRYELPFFNGDYVLLTPKDLLTRDNTWINRPELLESIDDIAASLEDESLRAQINNHLYRQLSKDKEPTEEELRAARAATVAQFPQLIEQYIRAKEKLGRRRSVRQQRASAGDRTSLHR